MQRIKWNRIILIILAVFIGIPILLYFIPIRFVKTMDNARESKFYMISYVSSFSTDGGKCFVIGTEEGLLEAPYSVTITGDDPKEDVFVYDCNTNFIIYGQLSEDNVLHSEGWDVLNEVKGGCHKNYLTIYDYFGFYKLFGIDEEELYYKMYG